MDCILYGQSIVLEEKNPATHCIFVPEVSETPATHCIFVPEVSGTPATHCIFVPEVSGTPATHCIFVPGVSGTPATHCIRQKQKQIAETTPGILPVIYKPLNFLYHV